MNKYVLWPGRPDVTERLIAVLSELPQDKPWEVTIKPYVAHKTAEQLGYLWGVVLPTICRHIEDTTGKHYTTDDVYSWMIDEYAEDRVVIICGKPKVTKETASKMNVKPMSEFIEKVIQHAAMHMQLVIPEARGSE